jgi:acyl carrier protein
MDVEIITPKASFRESMAFDSLDFVELMMAISKYLDLDKVSDEEVRNIETVEQLVTYLERQDQSIQGV